MNMAPCCLECSLQGRRPRWWCERSCLEGDFLHSGTHAQNLGLTELVDFEEKGTSEVELGGRVEFLRVQPGKDHCQYKGWQHLLFESRRVKGLSENPQCSWSNAEECWRGAIPLWILLKTHGGKAYLQQACFYERRGTDGVKIFSCR